MENLNTKVVTGIVRFSYLNVWKPNAIKEGQEPKYSVSLIIPKSDKKTLKAIKQAIENAKIMGKAKFGGKIPTDLKTPLKDGDKKDDEVYENSYFINAKCTTKPSIVDRDCNKILDQDEVYSGCYGRASVMFFAYNFNGNKGISCWLNHIMKVKDGEPLGGRSSADSDFDDGFKYDEDDDLL